ncbi:hypothetical protein HY483_03110 [Candidatus Woesearchaeota archaeon]|nr:hypothetical protein [Candidatus Woesearchaeota archaeon]
MGAAVEEISDWELILEWRRCSKYILGFGVVPGRYGDAGELEMHYQSILKGLEEWEELSIKEQRSCWGRMFGFFSDLEFEVQSLSLLEHFSKDTLRGMSPIKYRELFLRYAKKNPQTIRGGAERKQCLQRLAELHLIRREWYDHTV